ncbi:MAG: TonB-dependent receptor [Williamsia sp.]|nr:TonB-dependent receptor [Williamsia sp.]
MKYRLAVFSLILAIQTHAQYVLQLAVRDKATGRPLSGVSITDSTGKGSTSNDSGYARISQSHAGPFRYLFSHVGYQTEQKTFVLPDSSLQEVLLSAGGHVLEEVTVISSTRNNQPIENAPIKVEVLGKEEMEEENTIKPGNIASILGDISGIQIQQSSPLSGNSNVKIQGLDGRYTQILRDGLPLFEGFSGGFGILQIPPLDLKQIELIKGSASTLYGGGAIGGLINLISRTPTYQQDGVVTLNQSTLKETNLNTYLAKRYQHAGYNFFGGITHQRAVDVDKDGFSDVPQLDAVVLHPRLFFYPDSHTTIATGYTGTFETRDGGDMQVIRGKGDAVHQYFEKNRLHRHTADLIADRYMGEGWKGSVKGSISTFTRSISTRASYISGNQLNYYTEASLLHTKDNYNWVAGVNMTGDRFKKLPSDPILLNNFENNTVGAFAQFTATRREKTTLEAGLRGDHHNHYGDFLLPRLALFHRFNEHWATRWGIGLGYKTPNPLAVQNIDYPVETILPLPAGIKAERSTGYNAEVNYKKEFNEHASLFINHAFFLTRIADPVVATVNTSQDILFSNAGKSIVTRGFDTYLQAHLNGWELYAGYTFTMAERKYLQQNQFTPLTPKNRLAFVIVYEIEDKWRAGLEGSYTGPQFRDGDSKTPGYMFIAASVLRTLGAHFSIVANCENLLDYRQSRHEALYTGSITNPLFKPLWAPIDGRVANLSLRWNWAAK